MLLTFNEQNRSLTTANCQHKMSPTSVTNTCRQHQCNPQRLNILAQNSPRIMSVGVCVGGLSVREKAKSYCTNMSINMRWQALEMS